jgi:hypothetical protein
MLINKMASAAVDGEAGEWTGERLASRLGRIKHRVASRQHCIDPATTIEKAFKSLGKTRFEKQPFADGFFCALSTSNKAPILPSRASGKEE